MSTARYKDLIIKMTYRHLPPGYDARLIAAQIQQESGWKEDAESPAGAKGLMQIMDPTWEEETAALNMAGASVWDPVANITVGCAYMGKRITGWSSPRPELDRTCLALASYNAGFGNLLKAQKLAAIAAGRTVNDYASIIAALPQVTGHNATETTQYVQKILAYHANYVTKGW